MNLLVYRILLLYCIYIVLSFYIGNYSICRTTWGFISLLTCHSRPPMLLCCIAYWESLVCPVVFSSEWAIIKHLRTADFVTVIYCELFPRSLTLSAPLCHCSRLGSSTQSYQKCVIIPLVQRSLLARLCFWASGSHFPSRHIPILSTQLLLEP